MNQGRQRGFTLIELSIVLVIIGLIVGGVLTGQSLITAAAVRAQITQIEKFNTAASTFRDKYGYLPGDIPALPAAQFGFASRGAFAGEGDGNSVIEGNKDNAAGDNTSAADAMGETVMFWVDLSAAHLIDGGFNAASSSVGSYPSSTQLGQYFPAAKIGNNNYVVVYSSFGANRFSVLQITNDINVLYAQPGMTVAQAYAIDKKLDDGTPMTGNVTATFVGAGGWFWSPVAFNGGQPQWQGQYDIYYASSQNSQPTTGSCEDNGDTLGNPFEYTLSENNGAGVNCALSFRMQAGD